MNKKLEKLLRSKKPEKGCVQMWTNNRKDYNFPFKGADYCCPIRIVYPSGRSEYLYNFSITYLDYLAYKNPCWDQMQESKSSSEAIKKMKAYDKSIGAKSIFLGNIEVEYL